MVAKSRKSVNTNMIEAAVIALGERNGSTVKSIFNYLLRTKKVRASSRAKVVLAIRRAVKSGVLTKKSANTFIVLAAKQPSRTSAKNRKRKTRRMRKKSVKKTTKRRRRQRKRKSLKKKSRKSSKKSKRALRKSQKKRRTKVNRKSQVKAVQTETQVHRKRSSSYPLRKSARGVRYTA